MNYIEDLPNYFKEELLCLLENEEQFLTLKEQLQNTPVVIEDSQYQISIDSIRDLYELKKSLMRLLEKEPV